MCSILLNAIAPILLVLPLFFLFLKERSKQNILTILLVSFIFIVHQIVVCIPLHFTALNPIASYWNWSGKILGLIFGTISYIILEKKLHPYNFMRIEQQKGTLKETLALSILIIAASFISIFDSPKPFSVETLLYQLSLPGLDEEILFRGLLLGLLLNTLKINVTAQKHLLFDASIFSTALLFGLAHGINISGFGSFNFNFSSFVWTVCYGYLWGWITLRSGSILQSLITHNVSNFLSNLLRML